MTLKYINKIKSLFICSNLKTTNILDGKYKSTFKGSNTMFDSLREYEIGDEIKYIDWKSSAKNNTLLLKQFIKENKHNILLVLDSSNRMKADTNCHDNKKNIAIYTAGLIAYIAIKNNDYVTLQLGNTIEPFKNDLESIDNYLSKYDKNRLDIDLNTSLSYIENQIRKKSILFIITDIYGIDHLDINIIKRLSIRNDILIISISDNYMYGENIFDIKNNSYIPNFFLHDKKLFKIEKETKEKLLKDKTKSLAKYKIPIITINSLKEINVKLIKLLEEQKHANK